MEFDYKDTHSHAHTATQSSAGPVKGKFL